MRKTFLLLAAAVGLALLPAGRQLLSAIAAPKTPAVPAASGAEAILGADSLGREQSSAPRNGDQSRSRVDALEEPQSSLEGYPSMVELSATAQRLVSSSKDRQRRVELASRMAGDPQSQAAADLDFMQEVEAQEIEEGLDQAVLEQQLIQAEKSVGMFKAMKAAISTDQ